MDGLFNTLKHAVLDIALDALHLKDDNNTEENTSRPGRHESSSSSWGPTPQESELGDNRPEWRRPGGGRDNNNEEQSSEWRRPRPARDEEEQQQQQQQQGSQPEWRRHRQGQGGDAQLSGGSWAQVVGNQEDNGNQGGFQRQETTESWQSVATGGPKQRRPHPHPSEEQAGWFRQQASEQQYAGHTSANVEPTDKELNDLSVACNRLWELDLNRLTPGQDYKIDCGEGKKVYDREDMSGYSLFKYLDQSVFQRPTYARFYNLLDNYHADESSCEQLTSVNIQEQVAFIEEISRTAPIKYLLKYLVAKRILPGSMEQFKETLQTLWFKFYGRGGTRNASSAFEHVFVGEIKHSSEVSGFHNWIQFYVEEAKGTVSYQGFILPRRRGEFPDAHTQLLTVQFDWNGIRKDESSVLMGVSPEFEVALYTLCFYAGQEDNYVDLGPYRVNVKCYRLGQEKIGSVFPIALD